MNPGIGQAAMLYATTAAVFFVVDLLWLGIAAKGFYERHVGGLMRDQVNWAAAALFYLIYIGGIQVFVLLPGLQNGSSVLRIAVMGALLGFFAYSTFDLTSLALVRGWSVTVTVVDMAWGTVLTGTTTAATAWLARTWLGWT